MGLRYGFLSEPMRGWPADGTPDWSWAAAERAGVPRSWRPCVTMFTDELPWLPERDKRLVMSEVVRAW